MRALSDDIIVSALYWVSTRGEVPLLSKLQLEV